MAKKMAKTNAVRLIEQQNISYEVLGYKTDGQPVDGISVAEKIGYPLKYVYKTLVAAAGTNHYYVFVVPVAEELDVKKAKKGDRGKENRNDCNEGAVSGNWLSSRRPPPIGMKKLFPTYIDASAETLDFIIISAGKIGMRLKLAPQDLARSCDAAFAEIV